MHRAVPIIPSRQHRCAARPLTGWRAMLLCLMIALLPLRGWAWASMVTPGATPEQAAEHVTDPAAIPAHQDSDTPPCHAHDATLQAAQEHAQEDAQEHAQEDAAPTHTSHHGCAQCDLCHAGVLPPAVVAWPQARPHHHTPGWFPTTDTGRQGTDGLFRPPRD